MMRRLSVAGLMMVGLLSSGCATSEPMTAPWLAAETLSEKETDNFVKITGAIKQRGCFKTRGNLAIYGQSGDWKSVACYGMAKEEEGPFLEVLKTD